jgi:TonB-dependent starch-binding outer membrane protein SusC
MRSVRWFSRRSRTTVVGAALVIPFVVAACAPKAKPTAAPTPEGTGAGRSAPTMESINSVEESAFGQQPYARVEELFIGRFPGVQVLNVNGQVQVRIRGSSSFNANTEPLILVDGQQLTQGSGGLIGLNPRDIQKIEVLKDAVSMAEFGVRGSNGVIRITTKRR